MLSKNCYDHVKPIIQSTKLQIASILPKFLRQSYRRTKWAGDSDTIKKIQEKLPDIFGQVSETEPSPCKILLLVFPQSGAKIRTN